MKSILSDRESHQTNIMGGKVAVSVGGFHMDDPVCGVDHASKYSTREKVAYNLRVGIT